MKAPKQQIAWALIISMAFVQPTMAQAGLREGLLDLTEAFELPELTHDKLLLGTPSNTLDKFHIGGVIKMR